MLNEWAKKVRSGGFPTEKHWAILIFSKSSVDVPGDERSRTNPGHGYPAHTITTETIDYWVFESVDKLRQAVEYLERWNKSYEPRPNYQVIEARLGKVRVKIEVEAGLDE